MVAEANREYRCGSIPSRKKYLVRRYNQKHTSLVDRSTIPHSNHRRWHTLEARRGVFCPFTMEGEGFQLLTN